MVGGFIELESRNPDLFTALLHRHGGDRKIKAVEISCAGDAFFLKSAHFLAVDIPTIHPVFDEEYIKPTEATKLIGLPLMIRRIFPDPSWDSKIMGWASNPHLNPLAHCLDLIVDKTSANWGNRGFEQYPALSRMLIAREDQKDITCDQGEDLDFFFKDEIKPKVKKEQERQLGMSKDQKLLAREKLVTENISRAKFEAFSVQFKEE